MKKRFKEENLKEIIEFQLKLNGYNISYDCLKDLKNWYDVLFTTESKEGEFMVFLKNYLKPFTLKSRIDDEIGWFILMYGLRIETEKKT